MAGLIVRRLQAVMRKPVALFSRRVAPQPAVADFFDFFTRDRINTDGVAEARLPDAVAALLRGNPEVLRGFTDEEAGLLIALLTRLIANLDRIASVEASPGTPISEKGD